MSPCLTSDLDLCGSETTAKKSTQTGLSFFDQSCDEDQ